MSVDKKIVFYSNEIIEEIIASFCYQNGYEYSVEIDMENIHENKYSIFISQYSADQVIKKVKEFLLKWSSEFSGIQIPKKFYIEEIREDWSEEWKKFFHGKEIGNKFFIYPPWEKAKKNNKINLVIDAGASFGTGHHPTTELCICFLEKYVNEKSTVLDIGCGSGVLTIASKKLGASFSIGFDIDKDAVNQSIKNAESNISGEKYKFYHGDIFSIGNKDKYDLIVINMLPVNFIGIIPKLKNYIKEHTHIIFSGILEKEKSKILDILNKYDLDLISEKKKGEWVSLDMVYFK